MATLKRRYTLKQASAHLDKQLNELNIMSGGSPGDNNRAQLPTLGYDKDGNDTLAHLVQGEEEGGELLSKEERNIVPAALQTPTRDKQQQRKRNASTPQTPQSERSIRYQRYRERSTDRGKRRLNLSEDVDDGDDDRDKKQAAGLSPVEEEDVDKQQEYDTTGYASDDSSENEESCFIKGDNVPKRNLKRYLYSTDVDNMVYPVNGYTFNCTKGSGEVFRQRDEVNFQSLWDDRESNFWKERTTNAGKPIANLHPLAWDYCSRGTTIWYQSKGDVSRSMFMLIHVLDSLVDIVVTSMYNMDRTEEYAEMMWRPIKIENNKCDRRQVAGVRRDLYDLRVKVLQLHHDWALYVRYILCNLKFDWYEGTNPDDHLFRQNDGSYNRIILKKHPNIYSQELVLFDHIGIRGYIAKLPNDRYFSKLPDNEQEVPLINKDLLNLQAILHRMRERLYVEGFGDETKVCGFKMSQVFWQLIHSPKLLQALYYFKPALNNWKDSFDKWPKDILYDALYSVQNTNVLIHTRQNYPSKAWFVDPRMLYKFANVPGPEDVFDNVIQAGCYRAHGMLNLCGTYLPSRNDEYYMDLPKKVMEEKDPYGETYTTQQKTPGSVYHSMLFPDYMPRDICVKAEDGKIQFAEEGKKGKKGKKNDDERLYEIRTAEPTFKVDKKPMPVWYKCQYCSKRFYVNRQKEVYAPAVDADDDVWNDKANWAESKDNVAPLTTIDWGYWAARDKDYPYYVYCGEQHGEQLVAKFYPFVDINNSKHSPYQSRFHLCKHIADNGFNEMKTHYSEDHQELMKGNKMVTKYFYGVTPTEFPKRLTNTNGNKVKFLRNATATDFGYQLGVYKDERIDFAEFDFTIWDWYKTTPSKTKSSPKKKKKKKMPKSENTGGLKKADV